MVRATNVSTGPRAKKTKPYAGSESQRQAQTKAQLRVLQKALKKAREFETRKVLRRLKAAQEARTAGKPEAQATESKLLCQRNAVKLLSLDGLFEQAQRTCGLEASGSRLNTQAQQPGEQLPNGAFIAAAAWQEAPALDTHQLTGNGRSIGPQGQNNFDKDLTANTSTASEAPACPSHRHNIAGAHQHILKGGHDMSSSGDKHNHPEASSAGLCSHAAAEKPSGPAKHGAAADAEAQALHTLAARILGAKCVQQAMQTVQAQHAKRARQAAKLKAQPGQASAPGEGRRQRSRKRKLEGAADQLSQQHKSHKSVGDEKSHILETSNGQGSQQHVGSDLDSHGSFSSGGLQQSDSDRDSGDKASHPADAPQNPPAKVFFKDQHPSIADEFSLSDASDAETDEEADMDQGQIPAAQGQQPVHPGKQPPGKTPGSVRKKPTRKKNRLGQRARKLQALTAGRPALGNQTGTNRKFLHGQEGRAASKPSTKAAGKGLGPHKGPAQTVKAPSPDHPSWQAKRAMAQIAHPFTASRGIKTVFE